MTYVGVEVGVVVVSVVPVLPVVPVVVVGLSVVVGVVTIVVGVGVVCEPSVGVDVPALVGVSCGVRFERFHEASCKEM